MQNDESRPGDLFIDRYMPGASAEEREEAIANLDRFVAVLVRIDARLEQEKRDRIRQISDSEVDSDNS